ncbi:MAG: M20 family metallopeptidase [Bacteroidales bacterium]|nr:M20 family metallopeptidase [Bacteroidales bacterium]
MKTKVKTLTAEFFLEAVAMRRYLHSIAELSGKEFETAKFVKKQLDAFQINNVVSMASTGWVATIEGNNPDKKLVALRADMDALPILEKTGNTFQSIHQGVMHACGHDVHTANLLASAWVLNQLKDQWEGTIQLIFQPSEEKMPSGAARMLQEGIFQHRLPDAIIGEHVDPAIPVGKIGYRCGNMSASADECYITVKGKGGHGAYPAQFINPIVMASTMILDFQTIQNEEIPTIVTFGKMEALGKTNVVPEIATMEGTIRTFDESWRFEIHRQIREKAQKIAAKFGGEAIVKILVGYPVLTTDKALTQRCKHYLEDYFGENCMVESPMRMGADDFSYFSEKIPATMLRLGTRNEEKGITALLHTDTFDVDESIIKIGTEAFCWTAINELNQ